MSQNSKNLSSKIGLGFNKSWFNSKNIFYLFSIIFVITSSIIRFQNLWNLGFVFDTTETQYEWGKNAFEMGIPEFYKSYDGFFDYLPGNLLFLYFVRFFSFIFGSNEFAFVTTLKLFAWGIEIFLAFWLFKLSKSIFKQNYTPFFLASLSLILPSLFFVSSIWGQNDSIVIILSMLSLFFALKSRNEEVSKDFINLENSNHTNYPKSLNNFKISIFNIITNFTNSANLSALFFVVSLWFKLQTVLVLPILLLVLAKDLSWKKILYYLEVFGFLVSVSIFTYSVYLSENFENARLIMVVGFSLISILMIILMGKMKDRIWNFLTVFLIGFTSFGGLFAFLGLDKLANGLFAPVNRDNTISNGASTFWSILRPAENRGDLVLFDGFFLEITPSLIGYLIYIFGFAFFFGKLFKVSGINLYTLDFSYWFDFIKKLPENFGKLKFTFWNISFAVFWLCGIYFLFFTKMHSRYFHFSIVASLFLLALNKKIWKSVSFWIAFGMIHIGYFLNQIGVYTYWNDNVKWVDGFHNSTNFDYGLLSGVFIFTGFVLISKEVWEYIGEREVELKSKL